MVPPSEKVTVPVAADGDVVAVKVTLKPAVGVVFEAVSDVVVAWSAETATAGEVLVA